jgi:hypothetical protein
LVIILVLSIKVYARAQTAASLTKNLVGLLHACSIGITGIDHILAMLPEGMEKDIATIVLEYGNKQLSLSYAVRNDAVPTTFLAKLKRKSKS